MAKVATFLLSQTEIKHLKLNMEYFFLFSFFYHQDKNINKYPKHKIFLKIIKIIFTFISPFFKNIYIYISQILKKNIKKKKKKKGQKGLKGKS
jgi:predicted membrane protein